MVTRPNGSTITFDGDNVLEISEVKVPASVMPETLNVIKKSEPPADVAKPDVAPPEAEKPAPKYEQEAPEYIYYERTPKHHHTPTPPPPPVSEPAPQRELTAGERARQAFSTIPAFQAR